MSEHVLSQCPFCGGPVHFDENASKAVAGISWSIICGTENCILYDALPALYPTKREAAAAWNKRVTVAIRLLNQR